MKLNAIVQILKSKPLQVSVKDMDNVYNRAAAFVEKIPKENFTKAVESIFITKPLLTDSYLQKIDSLKRAIEKLNCPQEIKAILQECEQEAIILTEKTKMFSTNSKKPLLDAVNEFVKKFYEKYELIASYCREKMQSLIRSNPDEYKKFCDAYNKSLDLEGLSPLPEEFYKISSLPKGILPESGIMYHGTTKGRKVAKEGFSLFRSKQLRTAPREFGAGVYTTPDRNVAASFAGISGRIIPIKVNVNNTAYVNEANFDGIAKTIYQIAHESGLVPESVELSNATKELIINRLFREAGYDSVYTANSMASGLFAKSADEFIGQAQSQLVIFDTSKIVYISKKSITQKISDEISQIKASIKLNINAFLRQFNNN